MRKRRATSSKLTRSSEYPKPPHMRVRGDRLTSEVVRSFTYKTIEGTNEKVPVMDIADKLKGVSIWKTPENNAVMPTARDIRSSVQVSSDELDHGEEKDYLLTPDWSLPPRPSFVRSLRSLSH